MALLTSTNISRAGVLAASDGALPTVTTGDTFANTGSEVVAIFNGAGAPMTVTLHIPATLDGAAATDPTVTIADQKTELIGPFPIGIYNDAGGLVKVTCSVVTSSKIKILKQVINQ